MARVKLTDEERKRRHYERSKQWYQKNREKHLESCKQYAAENKEKRSKYISQWKQDNKEHVLQKERLRKKNRKQSDPLYKLNQDTRSMVARSFIDKSYTKHSRTSEILGCTWDEFKQHLEAQFEPWMHWGNRGGKNVSGPNVTWDIDHIIPLNTAVTEEDIIRLNHYTNLQPLCSFQNRFVKRGNTT